MFTLDYVKPGEAEGTVGDIYAMFPPEVGVPAPQQLLSASPGLLELASASIGYFMRHPHLEFPVLAAIRLMASSQLCYDYCVGFNSGLLGKAGLGEDEVAALAAGELDGLPFEEGEKTLLRLVHKVVTAPRSVTATDVQACRDAGWTDADILDASYQAAMMAVPQRLMEAFGE